MILVIMQNLSVCLRNHNLIQMMYVISLIITPIITKKCIIGLAYISKENAAKHNSPRDIVLKHIDVYLRNYSGWSSDETYSYEYEHHTGAKHDCPGFLIMGGPMTYVNNSTYKLKEPILHD